MNINLLNIPKTINHNDVTYLGRTNKQIIKKNALRLFKGIPKDCSSILNNVEWIKQLAKSIQDQLNKGTLTKEFIGIDAFNSDQKILVNYILLMARHEKFVSKDGKRSQWVSTNTRTLNQFLKEISKDTKVSNNMNLALLRLFDIVALKIFAEDKLTFSDIELDFNKMTMALNQGRDCYRMKIKDYDILLTSEKDKKQYNLWLNSSGLYLIPLNKDNQLIYLENNEFNSLDGLMNQINERLSPSSKHFFSKVINAKTDDTSKNFILGDSMGSIGREILAAINTNKLQLNQKGLDSLIELLEIEYGAFNKYNGIREFQESSNNSELIDKILNNAKFINSEANLIFMGNSVFGELTNNMLSHMYFRNILIVLNNVFYVKGLYDDINFGLTDIYATGYNLFGCQTKEIIDDEKDKLTKGKYANLKLNKIVLDRHIKRVFSNCHYDSVTNKLYISGFRYEGIYNGNRDEDMPMNFPSEIKLHTAFGVFNRSECESIHDLINAINLSSLDINTYFGTANHQMSHAAIFLQVKYRLSSLTVVTDQALSQKELDYEFVRVININDKPNDKSPKCLVL